MTTAPPFLARSVLDRTHVATAERAAAGLLAGFVLLAVVNACAIAVAVPLPSAGLSLRLCHHVVDFAETLGVGAAVGILVGALVRFARLPRWALLGLGFAACVAIVYRVAGDYLLLLAMHSVAPRDGASSARTATAIARAIFVIEIGLTGAGLVAAPVVASACLRRPRLRFLPLPVAVGVLIVDQILLRDDYMDVHGIAACGAILLGATALAPLSQRVGRSLARSRGGRVTLAALGLVALFGLAVPPGNATRFELFRQPCALAPWVLATALWQAPHLHAPVVAEASRWTQDRSDAPAVPPTQPPLLPSDAVVVLVTIDAVRAEAVEGPANDVRFPTLAKLKREGVVFTRASAPGTQTAVSLTTLFSGLYYSEEPWENYGVGWTFHPFPASDPAPRFPRLLSEHGVTTVNYASLDFLRNDFGVARGFREETVLGRGTGGAPAPILAKALAGRLSEAGDGPLFLYTHFLEAHAPYGGGRNQGKNYEKYLAKIAFVDKQLGRVLKILEEHFGQRWALFVSADHGEAFGEHQTTEHAKTLYEELLHVPLLVRSPLFPARSLDVPVGLVDLGPTILDLFGVETPATFEGQSLVPLLAGGTAALTRPRMAEGRLRRSLTEPDGLKVIEDLRRKVVEVYDLSRDPGETRNVFDAEPARSDAALAELRAFFSVHTWQKSGYEPPYKL